MKLAQKYGGKGVWNAFIRTLRGIPLARNLVRNIADHFTSIRDEISGLLMSMNGGLVRLDENNAAIMTQSDELKKLIQELAFRAYECEMIFKFLQEKHSAAAEDEKPIYVL
jgi:sigma54-dependent transcription regulator